MDNPFEILMQRIDDLEKKIDLLASNDIDKVIEIIDRPELCKRLGITEPTVIRLAKRGKIPEIRIGSSVRYNWISVVKVLEDAGK
jgi:excisionase family DNA binding protein